MPIDLQSVLCVLIGILSVNVLDGEEVPQTGNAAAVIHVKECRILLDDERQLASGQSGVVSKVHVREGDRVKKEQLLVELDAAIPMAALAIAEKESENDVNVRYARKAAELAATEYDLAIAANREQEQTFTNIEIEKLRLEKERSTLQIDVAMHDLKVAQLKRDEAKTVVDSFKITAPTDGLVTRVYQRTGEAVTTGAPILEMKKSSTVRIEADLKIEHLQDVEPGVRVKVVPTMVRAGRNPQEQYPEGEIFFVDVSADLVSQTVRILALVDNRQGKLIPGLQAELIIMPSKVEDREAPGSSDESSEGPAEDQ